MNETMKSTALRALLGFVMGILIGVLFLLGGFPDEFFGQKGIWATVWYLVYCGVYGGVCMGAQMVYFIDRFSITRATVSHFLIVITGLYILGFQLKWPLSDFLIMTGIMCLTYLIIWLTYSLIYRAKIRKMNEDLKRWKTK